MVDLPESKIDIILKAIEALSMKTKCIKDFVTRLHNDHEARTSQSMPNVVPHIFPYKNMTRSVGQQPRFVHYDKDHDLHWYIY